MNWKLDLSPVSFANCLCRIMIASLSGRYWKRVGAKVFNSQWIRCWLKRMWVAFGSSTSGFFSGSFLSGTWYDNDDQIFGYGIAEMDLLMASWKTVPNIVIALRLFWRSQFLLLLLRQASQNWSSLKVIWARLCLEITKPICHSFQLNMKLEKIDFDQVISNLFLLKLERLKYYDVCSANSWICCFSSINQHH